MSTKTRENLSFQYRRKSDLWQTPIKEGFVKFPFLETILESGLGIN